MVAISTNRITTMKPLILTLMLALSALASAVAGDSWTSTDGKTINADFVRIRDGNVVLTMSGKEYPVPLDKLDKKSQGYARFLQEGLNKWAKQNLGAPILSEQMLGEIIHFDAGLVEGRTYLVEGHVGAIGQTRALARTVSATPDFQLRGGTQAQADFSVKAGAKSSKIKVDTQRVQLLKASKYSKGRWSNFTPRETLLEVGQPVVVRVTVRKGVLSDGKLASSQEITEARLIAARQNGGLSLDELANLELIRIRIEFLEAQLESGEAGRATVSSVTGYLGTIKFKYSDAEKQAMQRELELLRAQLAAASRP